MMVRPITRSLEAELSAKATASRESGSIRVPASPDPDQDQQPLTQRPGRHSEYWPEASAVLVGGLAPGSVRTRNTG